ncbi:Conserved hypothetical protein [Synechococcus sp. RCC307]|nr:Conserved hypothetical protein [Synechococcus sp. RCC307]
MSSETARTARPSPCKGILDRSNTSINLDKDLAPAIKMETTSTQLPFEVDAAVLEQVAEFRRQQQASLELAGPNTDPNTDTGKGGGGGETKIDF